MDYIDEILENEAVFQAYKQYGKNLEHFLLKKNKNNLSPDERSHWEFAFENADDWNCVIEHFSTLKNTFSKKPTPEEIVSQNIPELHQQISVLKDPITVENATIIIELLTKEANKDGESQSQFCYYNFIIELHFYVVQ